MAFHDKMTEKLVLSILFLLGLTLVSGFQLPVSPSFVSRGDPKRQAASGITPPFSPAPPLGMSSSMPILDDWEVMDDGSVVGTVSNHPQIEDGDMIATSPIHNPNRARPDAVVTTMSGSQYRLGKPSSPVINNDAAIAIQRFFGTLSQSIAVNPEKAFQNAQRIAQVHFQRVFTSPFVKDDENHNNNGDAAAAAAQTEFMKQHGGTVEEDDVLAEAKRAAKKMYEAALRKAQRAAKSQYDLNGLSIGSYLLSGAPIKSTSGKSQIWTAYQSDDDGLPTGEPVVVKVSAVTDAIERELNNYGVVTRGFTKSQFVKCFDYYPEAAGGESNDKSKRRFMNQCALVMERGNQDLKTFVAGHTRGLQGHALRDAAMAAAQCLKLLHSSNMVWTDLKTENFIVMEGTGDDGSILVKGIDLESAMPARDNPVDYSPEACPPEFAHAFLSGNGQFFELDYSYDVWSYGMMLYEIATGDGIFDGHNPTQVTKKLADPNYEINVDKIPDTRLRNLAKACLRRDPTKRPSVTQIMLHSYFLTSYSPFSTFHR